MSARALSGAWLAASFACVAVFATPARAQFEEPDTIPRFSVGATAEVVFRGARGDSPSGAQDVGFGGGLPPVGARLEYRLSRTLSVGVGGGWGRLNERVESETSKAVSSEGFTQWQLAGELLLKVKPNIPGYFILGGGARRIVPDSEDPDDYFHDTDAFTDATGIVGAGVELGSRRSRVFKLDFRLYLVSPAEQIKFETKSVSLDVSLGASVMFRL